MHDVLIIGAGPAGLSAALWCDELGLSTLVLERNGEAGGQLLWIYNSVKNHLGASTGTGREMRDLFVAQAREAKVDLRARAEIKEVALEEKRVLLRSGESFEGRAGVIIATGLRRRRLHVPGEAELAGRGVAESASGERATLAGRDVCVVGGGDAAAENALLLAKVCPRVVLVHRGRNLSARREFRERLGANKRITVLTESVIQRIIGASEVEGVEILRSGRTDPLQINVQGVVVRIGYEPNTELFRHQVRVDSRGFICVTSEQETSIRHVFAIGDIANPIGPTISGAVGAGATAAKVIAARFSD
ncbi:MAG: FAD-dependent oxidoreductase [Pyrinomonadaceae bacterium]|nr:FAD-dependent oxidoreductase [Pyrinomonadaceae bacterium]